MAPEGPEGVTEAPEGSRGWLHAARREGAMREAESRLLGCHLQEVVLTMGAGMRGARRRGAVGGARSAC